MDEIKDIPNSQGSAEARIEFIEDNKLLGEPTLLTLDKISHLPRVGEKVRIEGIFYRCIGVCHDYTHNKIIILIRKG